MAARQILKVSARAFVSPVVGGSSGGSAAKSSGGGNPVTIFSPSPSTKLTPESRSRLAQTCTWESVVVDPCQEDSTVSRFSFFMPSGEEVSFCAHAAIGACSFIANKTSVISADGNLPMNSDDDEQEVVTFIAAQERYNKYNAFVRGKETELFMDIEHYESECDNNGSSLSLFLKEIGLNEDDINNDAKATTFLNSSVARPKTLIPVKSADRLHAATAPTNATKFQQMCESIDSTGLYLYDSSSTTNIECRQFPKSSGYAEDPATGIAAGALVASLHCRSMNSNDGGGDGNRVQSTTILQGTAMGRPSKIKVKIDDYIPTSSSTSDSSHRGTVKISYTGLVAFDHVSYLDESELS
ncbi:hypothetical protein ACHAWT_009448 [Skeletonema menzelii]